jgi:hypothetical protein
VPLGDQAIEDVRPDESGTTGYENLQGSPTLTFSLPCLCEAGITNSR